MINIFLCTQTQNHILTAIHYSQTLEMEIEMFSCEVIKSALYEKGPN